MISARAKLRAEQLAVKSLPDQLAAETARADKAEAAHRRCMKALAEVSKALEETKSELTEARHEVDALKAKMKAAEAESKASSKADPKAIENTAIATDETEALPKTKTKTKRGA